MHHERPMSRTHKHAHEHTARTHTATRPPPPDERLAKPPAEMVPVPASRSVSTSTLPPEQPPMCWYEPTQFDDTRPWIVSWPLTCRWVAPPAGLFWLKLAGTHAYTRTRRQHNNMNRTAAIVDSPGPDICGPERITIRWHSVYAHHVRAVTTRLRCSIRRGAATPGK